MVPVVGAAIPSSWTCHWIKMSIFLVLITTTTINTVVAAISIALAVLRVIACWLNLYLEVLLVPVVTVGVTLLNWSKCCHAARNLLYLPVSRTISGIDKFLS